MWLMICDRETTLRDNGCFYSPYFTYLQFKFKLNTVILLADSKLFRCIQDIVREVNKSPLHRDVMWSSIFCYLSSAGDTNSSKGLCYKTAESNMQTNLLW